MAVRVGESPAIWPDALMPVACEKLLGPLSMLGSRMRKPADRARRPERPDPPVKSLLGARGRASRTVPSPATRG